MRPKLPPRVGWFTAVSLALALVYAPASAARAQPRTAYEFDPYVIRLWVVVEPSPRLSPDLAPELAASLQRRSEQIFGPIADVKAELAPLELANNFFAGADVELDAIAKADPKLLDGDKLIIVVVRSSAGSCRVSARELDCRLGVWGLTRELDSAQPANVTEAAVWAVAAAFAPVVRIERVSGDKASARLRAGGLITRDDSSGSIQPGAVLQPVLRRRERPGQSKGAGVRRLAFSYLHVTGRDGHRLEANIHSGSRASLGSGGARTEKLAILVRPDPRGTRITLQSRGATPAPLVDYEVLARPLDRKAEPVSLGFTDAQGAVQLPLAEEPIRYVYVRHGFQMLARVPIVPGLVPEQVIPLTDDDPRLEAEGFYLAMQDTIMDLIAQREVLAARIRLRIDKEDYPTAEKLLAELRAVANAERLRRQINQVQAQSRSRLPAGDSPAHRAVVAKVDRMFAELQKQLAQHLQSKLIDDLAAELKAAKGG
jgi:hypothetical protein